MEKYGFDDIFPLALLFGLFFSKQMHSFLLTYLSALFEKNIVAHLFF